ncbi:MAG: rhodanese-like domain-containing protein [Nitrospirae bacterium]|nr:rhodanese-like domain-containing protein [Nitrospirota bacterium]
MDTASTILLVVIVIYLIFKLFGFLGRLGIRQISPKELDLKKGMMLLDVRTDKEHENGHIPGSVHVPLSDIGDKIKKLKKDKELVVYCQNGNRSIWAIKRLMGMGYKNLTNLKGGYNAWKRNH